MINDEEKEAIAREVDTLIIITQMAKLCSFVTLVFRSDAFCTKLRKKIPCVLSLVKWAHIFTQIVWDCILEYTLTYDLYFTKWYEMALIYYDTSIYSNIPVGSRVFFTV